MEIKEYSDLTNTSMVSLKHCDPKHRLMILAHGDRECKVNPAGYQFPKEGFDNISYYRDCSEIWDKEPTIGAIDFLDEIAYLDFKVSDNIRDNPNICEFILNYFNNPQETKVFHFVNFHMPLIPSEDWNIFCNLVNAFRFSKGVFLEIVNNLSLSYAEVDYDSCLDRVMMLDTKKFIGVDYHHIISNNEANFISLKNDSGVVGKTIPYDPKINYGNE
tara:strand:- start:576 stop:1226 length:651 start_codon:yes stop_codon:yes gene_type:complete